LSTSIEQTAVLTPLRVWIIGLLNTKIAIGKKMMSEKEYILIFFLLALIMSGP